MQMISPDRFCIAKQQGRPVSATVLGKRRDGYLLGNKFVFTKQQDCWLECRPGEFAQVKVWR